VGSKVSIIITTRNRAHHLRETLLSFRQLQAPKEMAAELLVVDNGSTDDTAAVARAAQLPQMPVRYLLEPKSGQSNARNSGMANTTGEIILFTDDDVRVPRDWIGDMCGPIAGGEADAVAGGVRMAPHLLRDWMKGVHNGWLAVSNEGFFRSSMTGANMAFSRKVLAKVPAFDPELGPGASGYSDDTLFSLQLNQAGFVIAKRYEVVVEHWIDEARLKHSSWIDAARKRGRTKAYLAHHWHHTSVESVLPKLLLASLRLLKWRVTHPNGQVDAEGCAEEELWLERSVSFHKQFLIERRRPRAYAQHGTVKIQTG
jgi:glucosyl-dolichyl phosphate glucuronosyltransferase